MLNLIEMIQNEIDEAYDFLLENELVEEAALDMAFYYNGYNMSSINDVCHYYHGMDFEQLIQEMNMV